MAPRPSSPTSLLWAHQLKREHGYLLKRMQDLEASSEREAKRIKTTETATKSGQNTDVAALAKQIKALDENGVSSRLSKLEGTLKQKTDDLEAGSEAITIQVAAMQKEAESRDEEKRKAFPKDKALLKRIGEIETGLKTYEQALIQMGRRVNDTQLEQIKLQLDGLSKQVTKEGNQMKMLAESITALEAANEQLRKSNQKLATELGEVAGRAATVTNTLETDTVAGAEDGDVSSAIVVAPRKINKKKNKPHRWGGGGADRDIIMSGAQMLGDTAFATLTKRSDDTEEPNDSEDEAPVPKRRRSPPKLKPKYKPIPPHLRTATPDNPSNPKKSHKWSGGGADKDIVGFGRGRIPGAASLNTKDRSKGAAQRPLPHPKKRIPTPYFTPEEASTQGRVMRSGKQIQPSAMVDMATQQRGRQVEAEPRSKANTKITKESKPTLEKTLPQQRQPERNLMPSSVVFSPPVRKPQPQPHAAPWRRRRIIQDD